MKKRVVSTILTASLALGLVACGAESQKTEVTQDTNEAAPAEVTYAMTSAPALNSVLNPNDEATFVFEVTFDPNTTVEQFTALTGTIQKSLTATMEYVQYTSSGS